MPVDLYGLPADITPIQEIATKHGLFVIEDCAQSHGATSYGKPAGFFADDKPIRAFMGQKYWNRRRRHGNYKQRRN